MEREYQSPPNSDVSSAVTAREETITFYRASVEIFTPAPSGGSYIEHESCRHRHVSTKAALTCGRGLARRERAKRVANGARPL